LRALLDQVRAESHSGLRESRAPNAGGPLQSAASDLAHLPASAVRSD